MQKVCLEYVARENLLSDIDGLEVAADFDVVKCELVADGRVVLVDEPPGELVVAHRLAVVLGALADQRHVLVCLVARLQKSIGDQHS